jgi:rhamnose utilization protein RhaD (predicted bifunctional aldolase and dehydrogenase)
MKIATQTIADQIKLYCARIGDDPLLVQGAGGNVSWKDGDTLWVKASGTWLAEADKKDIFVPVDLSHLRTAIVSHDFTVTPKALGATELRPSIETLLHALMPHRIVVHLHAIEILAHLVRQNCENELLRLVDVSVNWAIVEYYKPGAALASAVCAALTAKPNVNVVFLKNHGVVVGGANIAEVSSTINQLIMALRTNPIGFCKQTLPVLLSTGLDQYIPAKDSDVHQLAFNTDLYNRLHTDWALYPDHVVFLGARAFAYKTLKSFLQDKKNKCFEPELIFILNKGVFVKRTFSISNQLQLHCYYDVLIRQKLHSSIKALDDFQISELLSWDAEQYRQKIAK